MIPYRAAWTASLLLAVAFSAGCYTAPGAYPPPPLETPGYYPPQAEYPYAASPEYAPVSAALTIVTRAPAPPIYDSGIWYYGAHPHPVGHSLGSFCQRTGAHGHDYAPYARHLYEFQDGYYFWVGDPRGFGIRGAAYAYHGHHPHPHYFGGHCYISGRHHHSHPPRYRNRYSLRNNVLFFSGTFGHDYHQNRHRYDERGWRNDHRDHGYHDHERHYREARARDSSHRSGDRRDESHRVPAQVGDRDGGRTVAPRADADARNRKQVREVRERETRAAKSRTPQAEGHLATRPVDLARVTRPPRQKSRRVHAQPPAAPTRSSRRAATVSVRPEPTQSSAPSGRRHPRESSASRGAERVQPRPAAVRREARQPAVPSRSRAHAAPPQASESRSSRRAAAPSADVPVAEQSKRDGRKQRKGRGLADADQAPTQDEAAPRRARAGGR